jgi:outer membrane protein TolC
VLLAREQIQQAYAEYNGARALWLPSLRGGMHWNKHEGTLLSSNGEVRNLSRGSVYAGAGAQAVGGGSPAIPGVFASFNLADAMFLPLAAQQRWGAREQGATVARNNTLLDVSLAYLELLRSTQDIAIAEDVRDKVRELSRLTDAYAQTGQGLQADADRLRVELGLRELDVRRTQEAQVVASARLTQLLRLEPCVRLVPDDAGVVRLCYVSEECACVDLVAQALTNRPELMQNRYLVGEAVERLRRERYAPLVPSLLLGASYGDFGGGRGSTLAQFDDRFDFDATAFWEVRNLAHGEVAARRGAESRLRQAQIQELAALDQVAREVTEAFAQVKLRKQQVDQMTPVVGLASESYDLNLARIQNGQGLPIEALQSAQALLQSRREYLRSLVDYNASQFTLQRALGWPVGGPELSAQTHPDRG